MAQTRLCSIEGCSKLHSARGFCKTHYGRLWRAGVIEIVGNKPSEQFKWIDDHLNYKGDDCLVFPFKRDDRGRARVAAGHQSGERIVSRIMCRHKNGAPKGGMDMATHSCGNAHLGCVNPSHLRWGNQDSNMSDMIAHGRSTRGEKGSRAKLTEKKVRHIRSSLDSGASLARKFGVTPAAICSIRKRRNWKHI